MTPEEFDEAGKALAEHALTLPIGPHGRQRDPGARLVPAGYSILLHYVDPSMPGVIYTTDELELRAGRLSVHRHLVVVDGDALNRWNGKPGRGGLKLLDLLGIFMGSPIALPDILLRLVGGRQPEAAEQPQAGRIRSMFDRLFGR